MSDLRRVNGNVIGWGSMTLKIGSERYTGVLELSYNDKRDRAYVYGLGPAQAPRGRTSGKYTMENVKIKVTKSTGVAIRDALARLSDSGTCYGDPTFSGSVEYVERDDTPEFVTFEDLVYISQSESHAEGIDALVEEIEMQAMRIYRNGLTLNTQDAGA